MPSIAGTVQESINLNAVTRGLGELAIAASIPDYSFTFPALQGLQQMSTAMTQFATASVRALVNNTAVEAVTSFSSALSSWLQTIDFSPLKELLTAFGDSDLIRRYDEINEKYQKAMFEAKWFPYAAWIADLEVFGEINNILSTSRASKNRTKRIDRVIFGFYSNTELSALKRNWRKLGLPNYMTRVLVQAVQAYLRREYALTVSALSTLWEGIIQEKVNDPSYRVSRKTRDNLSALIKENHFDDVFSAFSNEFIFYDCRTVEEVKVDVPGRHGIAHCWYDKYPSRKAALNAIIFTDFLLSLKPLDNTN